jgi:aminopeptidase N
MSRPFALPGTRPRFAPDRPIDVEHYRLAVTLDPAAQRIAGTATLTVAVVAPTVAELAIDAVELEIDAVRVDGAPARFRHDGKQLWIAATAAVGTRLAVAIDYRGQPRRGLYFTAPDPATPTSRRWPGPRARTRTRATGSRASTRPTTRPPAR